VKTPKRQYKRPKNRTKNPTFQMFGKMPTFPIPAGSTLEIDIQNSPLDQFPGFAADLLVRAALIDATDNEKTMIAVMIPTFLKFLRPKKKSSKPSKTTPGQPDGPEAKTEAE
jgi:hypothetical protein